MGAVPLRRTWPLLPLAPAVVVVVGLAVAVAIGMFGLDHLSTASDEHAAARAELFAHALGARVRAMAPGDRLEALQLAARRTGAEYVVVTREGEMVLDASLGGTDKQALKSVVVAQKGEALTGLGRTRFAVHPLEPPPATNFLIAFVREPSAPEAAPALVRALLALTTLLIGIAAIVAFAVVRDANKDVDFVAKRVREMMLVRSEPTGEAVPIRTMDEVGALTSAFNELVGRFAAAEQKYRLDLERVRAADRDRAAFLAAVSHELRSPLNAILGFADILMTEVDGVLTASMREEVEQIRGSGQHLLDLINDILEFSALESGTLKLSRARVDLGALAVEVVREASGLIGERRVAIRVEAAPGIYAHADARRTRQILTNLVANAVKFTAEGEVVVAVAREGRFARVHVRDTGPGISGAERAMIFEEYKQAGDERRRKRGTGLGLAIARRLVLMHGGNITVESEIGRGSTFRVMLPAWFDAPEPRRGIDVLRLRGVS
jgi:signal transduction histidine kinase